MQPPGKVVGDFGIVGVAEHEMGAALDANLGKMDEFCLATVLVDGVDKLPGHLHADEPLFAALRAVEVVGNEVAKVDDDENAGQFGELFRRHGEWGNIAEFTFQFRRRFALR